MWVASTTTSISIAWTLTTDDGGCPVTEYRLYRDAGDGSGVTSTEIHRADLALDRSQTRLVVTELPAGSIGKSFVFRLKVFTEYTALVLADGIPGGPSHSMILAGVPDAPSSPPARGPETSASVVQATFGAVTGTNGAAIRSYEVQVDDGLGGPFASIQGGLAPSLLLAAKLNTGVVAGRYYRVRYRALNAIGPGPFSPTAYVLAAGPPEKV